MLKKRKSIRLKHYDYSTIGAYFITICAFRRICYFGNKAIDSIIEKVWHGIPDHFDFTGTDEFVVMPNHIHGILWINNPILSLNTGNHQLPYILRSFKSAVTRELHIRKIIEGPVWQRNYFERVIRNDKELNAIRKYIVENPTKWDLDRENPLNTSNGSNSFKNLDSIFFKT